MISYLLLFVNGLNCVTIKGKTLQGVKNKATRLYKDNDLIIKTMRGNTSAIKRGGKWRTVSRFTK